MTFGIPFSINVPDRLNLLICNKNNAKTFFFTISGLPFWHQKINHQSMFCFPNRVLDLIVLLYLFVLFFFFKKKNDRLRDPFKIQWDPNGTQNRQSGVQITKCLGHLKHLFCVPAFHETIVITVSLGPSGFLKVIFSTENDSFLLFLRLFILCFIWHVYHLFKTIPQ